MALGTAAHAAEVMQAMASLGNVSNRAADIKDEREFQTALTIYAQQAESQRRAYEMQLNAALQEYKSIREQKVEALKMLSNIGLMGKAADNIDNPTSGFSQILENTVNKNEARLNTLSQQEYFYQGKIHAAAQLVDKEQGNLYNALSTLNKYHIGTSSPLIDEAKMIAESDKDYNINADERKQITDLLEENKYSPEAIQGVFDRLATALPTDKASSLEERKIAAIESQVAAQNRAIDAKNTPDINSLLNVASTMLAVKKATIDPKDVEGLKTAYSDWYDWTDNLFKSYGYSGIPSGFMDIPTPEEVVKKPGLISNISSLFGSIQDQFDMSNAYWWRNAPDVSPEAVERTLYAKKSNALPTSNAPSAGSGSVGYKNTSSRTSSKKTSISSSRTTKKPTTKKKTTSSPTTTQRLIGVGLNYHTSGLKGLF